VEGGDGEDEHGEHHEGGEPEDVVALQMFELSCDMTTFALLRHDECCEDNEDHNRRHQTEAQHVQGSVVEEVEAGDVVVGEVGHERGLELVFGVEAPDGEGVVVEEGVEADFLDEALGEADLEKEGEGEELDELEPEPEEGEGELLTEGEDDSDGQDGEWRVEDPLGQLVEPRALVRQLAQVCREQYWRA